ncbi:RlpA-like double-psi beta-barrel-protein domain-containing protein-containing protein, partial [Sporodiniella umbellata]
PGLGSCGWDNSSSDMIVALNHEQMGNGENSNKNPKCGKYINVKGPNGSVRVKVVDTCPGCSSGDLDLSPSAFAKIAKLDQGRVSVSWSWA